MDIINDKSVHLTIIERIMKLANEAERTSKAIMVRSQASKTNGIFKQLQELCNQIENYEAPYNKILTTLEAIINTFKRRNIQAEELKQLITQGYYDIINMGIKYASEDAVAKNKSNHNPLTIKELKKAYQRGQRECKYILRDRENPMRESKQLQSFNYSFLIGSQEKIELYLLYFDHNIRLLIKDISNMINNCSDEEKRKMLEELEYQLKCLRAKDGCPYFRGLVLVFEIETLRQQMHKNHPFEVLLCEEYQYFYVKLLEIAKQIACENIYFMEESHNKLRTPLLRVINSNVNPKELYTYIEIEFRKFKHALKKTSDNVNPEDTKIAKKILADLERLSKTLVPYETFKTNLYLFALQLENVENAVSSTLLKGIITCICEFAETIERVEMERLNKYLKKSSQDIKDTYLSLIEIIKRQEQRAASLEKQFFAQPADKINGCKVEDVDNAWNAVIYSQLLFSGIKRYALINKIELEPGSVIQPTPPEGQ